MPDIQTMRESTGSSVMGSFGEDPQVRASGEVYLSDLTNTRLPKHIFRKGLPQGDPGPDRLVHLSGRKALAGRSDDPLAFAFRGTHIAQLAAVACDAVVDPDAGEAAPAVTLAAVRSGQAG